jgi:hypothetical protein
VDNGELSSIPGAKQPPPPEPLLANLGKARATPYLVDLQVCLELLPPVYLYVDFVQMMTFFGEERTLHTWAELTAGAGWKIIEIFPVPGSIHQQILAVPA